METTCAIPYSTQIFDHHRDGGLVEAFSCGYGHGIGLEGVEMVDCFAVGFCGHGAEAEKSRKESYMYRDMVRR